jgi:hypothetical protein
MGLAATRMSFHGTRGFQLGLFGTEADRMRSHGTSGDQNEVSWKKRPCGSGAWKNEVSCTVKPSQTR